MNILGGMLRSLEGEGVSRWSATGCRRTYHLVPPGPNGCRGRKSKFSPLLQAGMASGRIAHRLVWIWMAQTGRLVLDLLEQGSDSPWIAHVSVLLEPDAELDGLRVCRGKSLSLRRRWVLPCRPECPQAGPSIVHG